MKRNFTALLLTLILILTSATSILAADESDDIVETGLPPASGALNLDTEKLATLKATVPGIADVKLNRLAADRINAEYGPSQGGDPSGSGSITIAPDGEEIVSSRDITISLTSDSTVALPTKVDNSSERTFPVIGDQGNLNSCVGWSLGYYQLTNNANKIRKTYAKNGSSNEKAHVYSPNWIYNLGNLGSDRGMYMDSAINVLYTYGSPDLSHVSLASTSTPANYLSWYPSEANWVNALYNKCEVYYGSINPTESDTPITASDKSSLDNLKRLLADGYVVTMETYVDNNLPVTKRGTTSDKSSAYVWTEVRDTATAGGHAVTIVGYDDNFQVDINGNGSIQPGEKGAFKIANSWGTRVSGHNNGYVWLAYDALNNVSSVQSSRNNQRTPAIRNDLYYFVKPLESYKPLLIGTLGIQTKQRNNIYVTIGIEDAENPSKYYEQSITQAYYHDDNETQNYLNCPIAFHYAYGSFNLSGSNTTSIETVSFDFTSLLKEFEIEKDHNYKLYIKLKNSSNTSATINSFTLRDMKNNANFTSDMVPISATGNEVRADAPYIGSTKSVKQDKIFTLNFNNILMESTADQYSITVTDEDDNYMPVNVLLNSAKKSVSVGLTNKKYTNDFYTINILPTLKTQGGNHFPETVQSAFYVPYH